MEPTPRDQRVKVLHTMALAELSLRARSLGYDALSLGAASRDELIAMILDAEQDLGVTSR